MKAMLCEKDLQTKDSSNEVIYLFGPDFLSLFSFIQSYGTKGKWSELRKSERRKPKRTPKIDFRRSDLL